MVVTEDLGQVRCWICAVESWRAREIQVALRAATGAIEEHMISVCPRCFVSVSEWVREHPGQPWAMTAAVSKRLSALLRPLRLEDPHR